MYQRYLSVGLLLLLSTPLMAEGPKSPYSREELLIVKNACIELGNRYAHYLDSGQNEKIPELFDEHGSWQSRSGKYTGREDIKLAFSNRPKNRRSVHIITNHLVEVQSEYLAEVRSNFVTYQTDQATGLVSFKDQPVRVGHYLDECVRDGDKWIFQSRKMQSVFDRQKP